MSTASVPGRASASFSASVPATEVVQRSSPSKQRSPRSAWSACCRTDCGAASSSPVSSRTAVAITRSPGASAGSRPPENPQLTTRRGCFSTTAPREPPPTPTARATISVPENRPRARLPRRERPKARATLPNSPSRATSSRTGPDSRHSPHADVWRGSSVPLRRSQISCDLRAVSSPVNAMSATSTRGTRTRWVAASSKSSTCVALRS